MIVGINGAYGFIGYHLWVYLNYKVPDIEVVRLPRDINTNLELLSKCDVIFHMAERNKGDLEEIYKSNIESTKKLVEALTAVDKQPLVIYTSSIHQDRDDLCGQWRRDNIATFKEWARYDNFLSVKLPNIFGPFCKPNYNSFVATFCDAILNNRDVEVSDGKVGLLYVENLCKQLVDCIELKQDNIQIDRYASVSEVYNILSKLKKQYIDEHRIPMIWDSFEMNLFTTLRSHMPHKGRVKDAKTYKDSRGKLLELAVFDSHGQMFYSTTTPNSTRGNHFHTKRIERFCILSGTAQINMRKVGTDEIISYIVKGNANKFIDMPPYYTHNLVNIGDTELMCCFWMNDILQDQFIDDTYAEKV